MLRAKFEPHGLLKEIFADLVAQLRDISALRSAYFSKKRVKLFQDRPRYVLGYRVAGLFSLQGNRRLVEVLERIQTTLRFPGQTLFVNANGENDRYRRQFRRVRKSKVPQRAPTLAVAIRKTSFKKTLGPLAVLNNHFLN